MKKDSLLNAVKEAIGQKGDRKFKQSVDLAINFTPDVDFKKAENRLNAEVILPHKIKDVKVAVFADGQLATDARNIADRVIPGTEIEAIAKDKKKQSELMEYALLASPQLMAQVGKVLGQALGAKGKLPKPVLPGSDLKGLVEKARQSLTIKSKGAYLPVVHCIIGREDMPLEEIAENAASVLEAIEKKIPEQQIRGVIIKTTMGKPASVDLR